MACDVDGWPAYAQRSEVASNVKGFVFIFITVLDGNSCDWR
jgi:hypothetical protein